MMKMGYRPGVAEKVDTPAGGWRVSAKADDEYRLNALRHRSGPVDGDTEAARCRQDAAFTQWLNCPWSVLPPVRRSDGPIMLSNEGLCADAVASYRLRNGAK